MSYSLEHHDLLVVPLGSQTGIYWVRLYRDGEEAVATVTEVPGNPGPSATNATTEIVDYLGSHFDVDPNDLILFEIYPDGSVRPGITRVTCTPSPEWIDATRNDIEALVRDQLPALPSHGELRQRVFDLGGESHESERPVFAAVPVADLPPPHRPWKCAYSPRFDALLEARKGQALTEIDVHLEAGRKFLATLASADISACPFHEGNWAAIADESVRIITLLGRRWPGEYVAEAQRSSLPEADRAWLVTLFAEPIDVEGPRYTNGQHRGCALRFSGAKGTAVVVGFEPSGELDGEWTYEGAG